ncbi:MAG: hypothetical protein F6K39_48365 [Okeania sp. SIO3B3]|nr:hypothetical protein [Okeania sp. SIO3B3]
MSRLILPVPHIQQRQQGDCLVACAVMLLQYLGRPADYKALSKLLQVRPHIGTPAANIRNLETLGVTVIYTQGTWADLEHHLAHNRPCLALVQTGELPYWQERTEHAVVVVGLDETFVYLNDPDFPDAPIQTPRNEFDLAWLEQDEHYAVLMPA